MAFKTMFSKTKRIYQNPGTKEINDYAFVKDDKGESVFRKVGSFSLYEKIQSYKDSCDLNKIIEKFIATGDPSVLMQRQGFYADVTEYPTSLADMLDKYEKAKDLFYSLDSDDRALFNNDPDQFYSSVGTEKFNSVFNKSVYGSVDTVNNSVAKEKNDE